MDALTSPNHHRKLLEPYCSWWNCFDHAEEKPFVQPFSSNPTLAIEYRYVTYATTSGLGTGGIHFVRVSSGSTGGSQKEWAIHGIPSGACVIHPPSGLLAVVDDEKPVLTRSHEIIITIFNQRIGRSEFTCRR